MIASGIAFANGILFNILLYSNIILCIIFFFMARDLAKYSKLFESKHKNIKVGIEEFLNKLEFGPIILGLLSIGFLFNFIPIILSISLDWLPSSPFLDIIGPFFQSTGLYNKVRSFSDIKSLSPKERFLFLTAVCASWLSFVISLMGIYYGIFRDVIIDSKIKGWMVFIIFIGLAYFFGIPLMLRLLANEGIFLIIE